jgi:hypothetical protein
MKGVAQTARQRESWNINAEEEARCRRLDYFVGVGDGRHGLVREYTGPRTIGVGRGFQYLNG